MTSRSLFFKLMKEDIKQKFWAIGLAFLSFFCWMPVMTAMRVSDIYQMYERWLKNGTTFGIGVTAEMRLEQKLLDLVIETIGLANPLTAVTMVGAAVVLGLTGFLYLHSRKQVDFYHSIPVRREMIFWVKYLNGAVIVAVTYLINMVLACAVLAVNEVDLAVIVPTALITFALHMGGFLINYGLMTVAVMLTGNFFISILGAITLFAYIPAVLALIQGLMFLFFETITSRSVNFSDLMTRTSPIVYYIMIVAEGAQKKLNEYHTVLGTAGICWAVGALMAVVAMLLYKMRPSESAGKAMAFRVEKAPIKILLVTPITIATSLLFWNIYYSFPWAVFGFVMGLVVTHSVIEIIYHFEFRKLFSNLHHMGICAAVALAIIGVFRYDLIGYDSYVPEEEEFQSAYVYPTALEQWLNYGHPYMEEGDDGPVYSWMYEYGEDIAVNGMKVTDYDLIRPLADAGIAEAKRVQELRYGNVDDTERAIGYWTNLTVGYTLKNGKVKHRLYMVRVDDLRETFEALYTTEEYKSGIYPVMNYTADQIDSIYEYRNGKIQEVTVDEVSRQQILETYQREMAALTLNERSKETPVTSLRFLTQMEYEYICQVSASRTSNYTGDFRMEDMRDVNFFPVYPSFTGTLELLEEAGVEGIGELDLDDIARMEIYSDYYIEGFGKYLETSGVYSTYITDTGEKVVQTSAVPLREEDGVSVITVWEDGVTEMKDQAQEVLDVMVDHDLAQMNRLQPLERGLTIRVYLKAENEGRSRANETFVPFLFPADQIPEFVKIAFQYDEYEHKNVNYGLNGK